MYQNRYFVSESFRENHNWDINRETEELKNSL